ncbi:glycoside hydrolase family 2 [Fusarium acutatum]|uniref:Glycoside hydrolase family 2 n=1 Tax=Fusarium acutatum TaxID=78861 RepID=A0A8H4JUU1_9HYPO|nr:glycoside hydrolase family 2 [Fusarium acutatum]
MNRLRYPKAELAWSEEDFLNPPAEYRGAPLWCWNTKLERGRLLRQIDQLAEMGMGGFHIHSRVGLDTPYMGEEFMEHVKASIGAAKAKGVLACLYDEDRWSATFFKLLQLLDVSRSYHDLYLSFILLQGDDESGAIRWLDSFHSLSQAANNCLESLTSWCQLPPSTNASGSYANHSPYTRTTERLAITPRIHDIQAPVIMVHAYGHALTIYVNGLLEFSDHRTLARHDIGVRQNITVSCANSARAIIDIASTFVKTHGDRIGWPLAWSIWTAARYLLTAAKAAGSIQLSSGFNILLDSLQDLGKYWQISKKYWWLLYRASESFVTVDIHTQSLAAPAGEDLSGRAGETHPPTTSSEKPGNAQRILSIITDLRVPTSDVEDQFRVDPVFSVPSTSEGSATGADGTSSPAENQRVPPWQTENIVESDDAPFLNEFAYNESLYMSDMWFNTPLFATSGYQQFCEDVDHV